MSLSWKDTTATVGIILIIILTVAMMLGAFESIDSRWAFGTFAIFLLAGFTGLITGTARIMEKTWLSILLYTLAIASIVITVVNAFLNSEAWFIAMAITVTLAWVEFVTVDFFSTSTTPSTGDSVRHARTGGSA